MAQQMTLNLKNMPKNGEFMLWHEDTKATVEEAIRNANRYYYQKYGVEPARVVLPPKWQRTDKTTIKSEPLEKILNLIVETNQMMLPKHVAVYKE